MSSDDNRYDPTEHEPLPEGEEAPPRYVRTMAMVRWGILAAISLFALVMIAHYAGLSPWKSGEKSKVLYTCPMHPTYIANQPGDCPICGMSLVPVADNAGMEHPAGKDTGGMEGDMGKAPVPGLVPVTIEPQRLQLIGVRKDRVQRRSVGGKTTIVGYVTSDETRTQSLHVRVMGWVQELFVNETGQVVKAGQPLMSLYSQELYQAEQDYIVARDAAQSPSSDSALTAMRRQLLDAARERLRLLGIPDEEIARIEQASVASSQMTLRSPFSGYVLEKNVLPGQYIGPEQNLYTIADLSTVWVLGDIYEQDIKNIHVGQPAHMSLTAYPGEIFEGRIDFIYPSISQETRTLKVRIEFANPSNRLRPGMYAQVSVTGSVEDILAVPADAVMDNGDMRYLFVVHDGMHFEPRLVTTGRETDDWIEVVSGVVDGEEVVTSANFLIDSESRLKAAVSGMGGMPGMPDMPDTQNTQPQGHIH